MEDLKLSPHVMIGAPMRVADKPAYYVKDRRAGRYFRLNPAEKVVVDGISRGDPEHVVAAAAAAELGRPVTSASVRRLAGNLLSRGILVPRDGAATAPPPTARAPGVRVKGPLEVYVRFGTPARLTERVAWLLGPVPNVVLELLAAAGLALAAWAFLADPQASWEGLVRQAVGPFTTSSALLIGLLVAVSLLHELAHAVACRRAGGQPGDMGLMFRYGLPAFYCQIDDLVVIASRRARLRTVLAGPMSHAFAAAPFAAACLVLGPASHSYSLCLTFVVLNLLMVALNLLPFLQMDGYLLISTGFSRPELRQEAQRALLRLLPGIRAAGHRPEQGPRQLLLALYGATSLLVTAAVTCGAFATWLALCYLEPTVYGAASAALAACITARAAAAWLAAPRRSLA